jgi:hypothetical protein
MSATLSDMQSFNSSRRTMSAQFSLLQAEGSSVVSQYCWHTVQSSCLRTRLEALSAGRATTDATSAKRKEKAASFIVVGFEAMAVGMARRMVGCEDRGVGTRERESDDGVYIYLLT